MKIQCTWNQKMKFEAKSEAHSIIMDAKTPLGENTGMTPKELVLAGICGCTAMDVAALLKKYKQPVESFVIDSESSSTEGAHPAIFKEVKLVFKLTGTLDSEKVLEAIKLSQTKYCGVSAMISKSTPIIYRVELNNKTIGNGKADFGETNDAVHN